MYRNPGMPLWYNFFMKLGSFNQDKAKTDAKLFLQNSISSLAIILDYDTSMIDSNSVNPFSKEDARFYGFEILKSEIEAYNKL
jgi:hypothetical protein